MQRPIWSLACNYFARLFGHFRYAASFLFGWFSVVFFFSECNLQHVHFRTACKLRDSLWMLGPALVLGLYLLEFIQLWCLKFWSRIFKKCRAAWWIHCLESFLIQELSLKWHAGIWERYIRSLMLYSPCILTAFLIYFIIFTPLSPGLMSAMVLADFTVSSYIICKHTAFGPSPCGEETEPGKIVFWWPSMIWSKSICTFGSTVLLSLIQG